MHNSATATFDVALVELESIRAWLDRAQNRGMLRAAASPAGNIPNAVARRLSLTVDTTASTVTLNGVEERLHDIKQIVFLDFLIHAGDGEWVSGEKMNKDPQLKGSKLTRIRASLAKPYGALVESRPGSGFRLR